MTLCCCRTVIFVPVSPKAAASPGSDGTLVVSHRRDLWRVELLGGLTAHTGPGRAAAAAPVYSPVDTVTGRRDRSAGTGAVITPPPPCRPAVRTALHTSQSQAALFPAFLRRI